MINSNSITATNRLQFGEHFVKPAYGSYCFAHIPDTIKQIFGIEPAQALPDEVFGFLQGDSGNRRRLLRRGPAFSTRLFRSRS